jgi:DegV family protein with EDD domain
MGEETYRDGVDIGADEFYERLPQQSALPTTSQPSVGDFVECYRKLEEEGANGILSIHLSSGISGTINSATQAAAEIGIPVEIVDTLSAAASHTMTVEKAAGALASGATMEEAAEASRQVVEAHRLVLQVDTLEYLYKGGRIGGAAALVGSLVQFKPILHFHEGRIDALARVRTSRRAMRRLAEIMGEWMEGQGPLHTMVMHAAAPDRAEELCALVGDHLDAATIRTCVVPPVLGAHAGPGTLGLCCCPVSVYGEEIVT